MTLYSDEGRLGKIVASLMVLGGLGAWYAWIAMNLESGYRWCLEDPVGRDGAALVFPLWTVSRIDGPETYAISKVVKDIPVRGSTAEIKVGDTVSLTGAFRAADRTVTQDVREVHRLRPYKEALGVLGFLVAGSAAPFFFRIRDGRLVERSPRMAPLRTGADG